MMLNRVSMNFSEEFVDFNWDSIERLRCEPGHVFFSVFSVDLVPRRRSTRREKRRGWRTRMWWKCPNDESRKGDGYKQEKNERLKRGRKKERLYFPPRVIPSGRRRCPPGHPQGCLSGIPSCNSMSWGLDVWQLAHVYM